MGAVKVKRRFRRPNKGANKSQGQAPVSSGEAGSQPGQSGGGDNQQRRQFMSQLPEDFAGRVKALQSYDFFDSDAQQAFNELMEMLKQQAMGNAMRDMAQRFTDMSPEERQRLKEMIADLNSMLDKQVWGEKPDFNGFMQKYGDMFGPNPPRNLEELTQADGLAHGANAVAVQQPAGRTAPGAPGDAQLGIRRPGTGRRAGGATGQSRLLLRR